MLFVPVNATHHAVHTKFEGDAGSPEWVMALRLRISGLGRSFDVCPSIAKERPYSDLRSA
jgi:hypothetical protein